ncbi:MAG: hypothetical protein E5X65_24620 [Mesorhizobium sp.]|nr:MAG: hypothetical protein E5X65_24620 [Mesorhizobium sp.]
MRWRLAVICLALSTCEGLAEDLPETTIFLPGEGGESAKIVDFKSGVESPVLGVLSAPPENCPPDAFWVKNAVNVVSCADGTEYRLAPVDNPDKFPGAMKLVMVKGGTETDEHPPMKYPPKTEDVKP